MESRHCARALCPTYRNRPSRSVSAQRIVELLLWHGTGYRRRLQPALAAAAIAQPGSLAIERVQSHGDGVLIGLGGLVGWYADQVRSAGRLGRIVPRGLI